MKNKKGETMTCNHDPKCSTSQMAINHPEIEESSDISELDFKQRLRDAGWSEQDIENHWKEIMEDDESGYDGP